MWGRFRQRKTKRSKAVEQATAALQNVRGRFGEGSAGRKERAYGSAVWLGAGGVLVMATLFLLLLWLLGRGRRSREEPAPTSPVSPVPEEDVEAVPPLGVVVPPGPPSAEDVPLREEPPPGEERPERRGETPPTPPTPREEPPPGEERPGGR